MDVCQWCKLPFVFKIYSKEKGVVYFKSRMTKPIKKWKYLSDSFHFSFIKYCNPFHFGIPFSPLNGHTNYVKIIKDGGCWSQIGMVGNGEQELSLVGNLGGIMGIGYST